eukprot:TRINITY_DN20506_c0_g1_i3.p1 TRINITY_DN20506_c0_g1~~TRINITY_DN20506_c0_g1_i3.p1  ORF type:complete len:341 (-),score=17.40 TRINITY_DN20506_c0_g1_i3:275-1297(-)
MSVFAAKEVVESFDSGQSGLEDVFYFRRKVAAVVIACVSAAALGKQCVTLSTKCPDAVHEISFCEIWPVLIWYSILIHLCNFLYFCAWTYAFRYSAEDLGPISKAKWTYEIPFLQCMMLISNAAPDYAVGGHLQIISNVATLALSAFFIHPFIVGPVNSWVILLGTTCPYVVCISCIQLYGKFQYEDVAFSLEVLSVGQGIFSLDFVIGHVCVLGGLGILLTLRSKEGSLQRVGAAQGIDEAPAEVNNSGAMMASVTSTPAMGKPPSTQLGRPQTLRHVEQDVEEFEHDDSDSIVHLSDLRPHTSVCETHRKSRRRLEELLYGRCCSTLNVVPTLGDETP